MWKYLVFAALLLAGCDGGAADGYQFAKAEYRQALVAVSVVEYDRPADLRAAGRKNGAKVEAGRELMAFAVLTRGGKACEVHVMRPETDWQPEWLGHEFAHCVYGRWHD